MRQQLLSLCSAKQPRVAMPRIDVVELPRSRIERAVEDGDIRVVDLEGRRHHVSGLPDARLERRNAGHTAQRRAGGGHHQ